MEKIKPKNLKKQGTTLTDHQIIKIDEQIRESKVGKRYTSTSPDDLVRAVNELCDNICKILVEFRRLNDVLSYLSPPNQNEK